MYYQKCQTQLNEIATMLNEKHNEGCQCFGCTVELEWPSGSISDFYDIIGSGHICLTCDNNIGNHETDARCHTDSKAKFLSLTAGRWLKKQ